MGAQAVGNEKDVAQKRKNSKCHDRRHAKTCQNTERGEESEEIDPGHSLTSVFDLRLNVAGDPLGSLPNSSAPPHY
jgi:hypothetical protein